MNGQREASPIVQQVAARLGVDLAGVTGTGVGGRIRREDVEAAAQWRPVASAAPRPAAARAAAAPVRGGGNPYAAAGGAGLPAFTASGLDPAALRAYPPIAWSVMAAVDSLSEAYRIGQSVVGKSDTEAAQVLTMDPLIPEALLGAAFELVSAAGTTQADPLNRSRTSPPRAVALAAPNMLTGWK